MGQLIDGVWHDTGTIPNLPAVNFNVQLPHFVTGSLPMALWPHWHRRFYRRERSLSSLCFTRLPVGAPHADHAQTQRTGTVYFRFRSEPADAGKRLDL